MEKIVQFGCRKKIRKDYIFFASARHDGNGSLGGCLPFTRVGRCLLGTEDVRVCVC